MGKERTPALKTMPKQYLRIIVNYAAYFLSALFAYNLLALFYLELTYCERLPETPQPQKSRTYEVRVNHGFIRFATATEAKLLTIHRRYFLYLAFAAVFVVGCKRAYIDKHKKSDLYLEK
jgi:hypothetical protein